MGLFNFSEVATYFFRKKDPNRKTNFNLRSMHFINKLSMLMFLIALNMGYSVMDFLYLKIILFSNEGDYIEEHQTGINILNKVNTHYEKKV